MVRDQLVVADRGTLTTAIKTFRPKVLRGRLTNIRSAPTCLLAFTPNTG